VFNKARKSTATWLATSFIKNLGNGKFDISALPPLAQMAPVYGMQIADFNNDGNLDIMLAGNDFSTEVFNGRLDACNGLILKGDRKGGFTPLLANQTGFFVSGNAKAMVCLRTANNRMMYIASENRGPIKAWKAVMQIDDVVTAPDTLSSYNVLLKNGKRRKAELYYGNGFLSQSSRYMFEK
jgi:hypothetical protein